MARANKNVILSHLSGTIGNQVTVRNYGDRTIVSQKQQKTKIKATEKQKVARMSFQDAAERARMLMEDPDIKALYQAAATPGVNAYNIALKDAYHAPEIISINTDNYRGKTRDTITVRAYDAFRVFRVTVAIYNADNVLVEEGNALINRNAKDWTYTATSDHPGAKGSIVRVMAEDIPGNETSGEIVI